ncbi:hypothetical protein VIGAN_05220300 [Vigna angularis var. angularis]|uniref:Uncharacterized protein n=1 Tax=Vigna angularis var. angularis TaxID=157739 RepID=A0A0S3S750_PHAAN|nr:hypothetical protein VIGAN_05220300 [Vigna angularis var. angularis]
MKSPCTKLDVRNSAASQHGKHSFKEMNHRVILLPMHVAASNTFLHESTRVAAGRSLAAQINHRAGGIPSILVTESKKIRKMCV